MKAKKILIVYLKGFLGDIASREIMFNKLIDELIGEGRLLKSLTRTKALFDDGTRVTIAKFSANLVGTRVTHVYIDDKITKLENGNMLINAVIRPLVVPEGVYEKLEVVGSPTERILTFNVKDGELKVNKFE